jgi:SOS response regulatory protein OraA/RecX
VDRAEDPRLRDPRFSRPLKSALAFLARRDRFIAEVQEYLIGAGYDEPATESVVQFLVEQKLINEITTVESHIARNSGKRAVGIERLRTELRELGAPQDIVDAILTTHGQSEIERATEALRAHYRSGSDQARAGRFLYSRGFDESVIDAVLDQSCESD